MGVLYWAFPKAWRKLVSQPYHFTPSQASSPFRAGEDCNNADIMVVYSFYIFDRHSKSYDPQTRYRGVQTNVLAAECIYSRLWARQDRPISSGGAPARPISDSSAASNGATPDIAPARARPTRLSAQDDAKLIFGTIFSLRNMVRKLGGQDDR